MADALDRLTAAIEAEHSVAESAVTLINGLAEQIRNAANQPDPTDALNKLADDVDAQTADLQAALTANTPAS